MKASFHRAILPLLIPPIFGFWAVGCSRIITLDGERNERARAESAEAAFADPIDKRPLPDLATTATLQTVLEYAFNSSGEIESAYREWRGAIERIPQAGALDDPKLQFTRLFSPLNIKSFGAILSPEILGSLRVMATQDLPAKGKRRAKAEIALGEAEAQGERFRAAKFHLQNRVTSVYARLALNEALLAESRNSIQSFRDSLDITIKHYHSIEMETAADIRKAEMEIEKEESDWRARMIARDSLRAELNGILGRPPDAPLGEMTLPDIELLKRTDAELFERAVEHNAELAALKKEIESRGAAQVLADLQHNPDFMLSGGLDDPLMPFVSAGMTLPINKEKIRAGIAEALAMRQAAEARLRAASFDAKARVVMALSGVRDAERVLADFDERIIPKADETLDAQLAQYRWGKGSYLEILETQRLLIELRKLTHQARADRLRSIGELEELLGEDLFAFVEESHD